MIPNKPLFPLPRRAPRALDEWGAESTRGEKSWSARPKCPMLPRAVADYGFLRDRLHVTTGAVPLQGCLTEQAVDATLTLMLRRGFE